MGIISTLGLENLCTRAEAEVSFSGGSVAGKQAKQFVCRTQQAASMHM